MLRKCARKIASGEAETVSVTGSMLEEPGLAPASSSPTLLNRTNAVGIANGLAWTSVGGETLPIEVQVIDNGSGKITVTGSLGDVMKESAQLAVTWVRSTRRNTASTRSVSRSATCTSMPRKAPCPRTAPRPVSP